VTARDPLAARLERALAAHRPHPLELRPGETRAGVLIPVIMGNGRADLLIERRAADLPNHAGQYGFPGGAVDPGDRDIVETALREAREEIALDPGGIEVIGRLSDVRTPTGYVVTPIVGVVPGPVNPAPSPTEVAFVILVPLRFLLAPGAFRRVRRRAGGLLIQTDALVFEGHAVWGMTARILLELRRLLRR